MTKRVHPIDGVDGYSHSHPLHGKKRVKGYDRTRQYVDERRRQIIVDRAHARMFPPNIDLMDAIPYEPFPHPWPCRLIAEVTKSFMTSTLIDTLPQR